MNVKILTTAVLATLAALGTASAADLPMPAPAYKAPPPPVYNWTGCYVGGGGGYGMWTAEQLRHCRRRPHYRVAIERRQGMVRSGPSRLRLSIHSALFGVQTVIGAFGDFEGGSINGSSSFSRLHRKRARILNLGSRRSRRRFGHAALSHLR